MITVIIVIHLMLAVGLIGVIMVQKSEGGALGMGSGGMSGFMSGRSAANLLTRTTAILAACFFATSIALALLANAQRTGHTIIDPDRGEDVVLRGMRLWGDFAVGMVRDCNWLQHWENIVDPYHLLMLHQWISGDQFEGALMQGTPSIGWEKTARGVRYNVIKDLPNGNRMVRHAECIVPNMFVIPSIREPGTTPKRKERGTELSWAVPVDNEHVRGISIVAWPLEGGAPKPDWKPGTDTIADIRPGSSLERSYEERQRKPDDLEAQEGQRAIAIHALENLAHSDSGIVMLRRLLREQLARIDEGLDPINTFRDAQANRRIPTGAWNTILSPQEAAALAYSEDL